MCARGHREQGGGARVLSGKVGSGVGLPGDVEMQSTAHPNSAAMPAVLASQISFQLSRDDCEKWTIFCRINKQRVSQPPAIAGVRHEPVSPEETQDMKTQDPDPR